MIRRTERRVQILTAYHVAATRYAIRDVLARAERLRLKLRIGRAFMCSCVLTKEFGKPYLDALVTDLNGPKKRWRTRF